MIGRLRWRLILLVVALLAVISLGIVLSIDRLNRARLADNAYAALELLARNDGKRPMAMTAGTPPPIPPGEDGTPMGTPPPRPDGEDAPAEQRQFVRPGAGFELQANLGNYAVITLNGDGSAASVLTERNDLYTEAELTALALTVRAGGASRGEVDGTYYLMNGDDMLIVLDQRLEQANARNVLYVTSLVAACAWLILSAGSVLLITRMLKPVDEAFKKQRQFVSDASHELKTPLAVISANAQALAREQGRTENTDYILSEVERADELVRSLLSLARLDRGGDRAAFERFDLSEAVLSVTLPFESTVFEAGRRLETDIDENVTLNGDSAMLRQLTVILLSNALKYSDEGGLIRVSLKKRGDRRVLTVSNTGCGVAPENREKVFDRFFREDASHNSAVPGSGLGLSLAKSIVDLHRGRIVCGGEWHKNAVFTVTL